MNSVEFRMKSKMENIKYARSAGVMFFHTLNLNFSEASEIKTVISEAVTNAIVHGYNKRDNEDVFLYLSYDDEKIIIEITDAGCGIKDIVKARTPMYSSLYDEDRSGIGFTIMEIFTDEIYVDSKENIGTTIRMIKYYRKEEDVDR